MMVSTATYLKELNKKRRDAKLLAAVGNNWEIVKSAKGLRQRKYDSYTTYLAHQDFVMTNGNLLANEGDQLQDLRKRLLRSPHFRKSQKVICVGANCKAVASAFHNAGAFAAIGDIGGPTAVMERSTNTPMSSFPNDMADIVYSNSLETLYDVEAFVAEAKRCLSPNGVLIVEGALHRHIGKTDRFYRSLEWTSPDDLVNLIEGSDFELADQIGMNFPKDGLSLVFQLKNRKELIAQSASLLFEVEEPFVSDYRSGIEATGTVDSGVKRTARFYNVVQFLRQTAKVDGAIAECGCWRGLSSFLICHEMKRSNADFDGSGYYVLDSFEGLSEPLEEDVIETDLVAADHQRKGRAFKPKGAYAADIDHVKSVLKAFPGVEYAKGWIPASLSNLPEQRYRFVHIDVDLYEPTLGALVYFLPRMQSGGIIVCDDYGSLYWPGAKKAMDEFAKSQGLVPLSLSSGQAALLMP